MRPGLTVVLALCVAGCAGTEGPSDADCLAAALQQPALRNGAVAWTRADGSTAVTAANWRGWWRLLRDQAYPAASLTKPLVAHAIRGQVERGALRLEAKAADLLPGLAWSGPGTQDITLQHLLQHTAGLGRRDGRDPLWHHGGTSDGVPDCEAAAQYIVTQPTLRTPGVQAEYSNVGYCLLGLLLRQQAGAGELELPAALLQALHAPLGAAGGWRATLPEMHAALARTLPLRHLEAPPQPLPDGSWYAWSWRYWPKPAAGAPWTHTGRLPGFLAVALTDGRSRLLVAHFDGDPADYHAASQRFGRQAWGCLQSAGGGG
ncbi:beta-lactamase family protein [Caldimonas thermodepolymerans]|nr:serine hydrolase domain-containing protein [Caldimonas thermodepolymerans]QPC31768.1 beta-lactamase family protein [Caldimonas thermodepolymerans]RDI01728.1 beta-lactamase [Caldimonas thermodepolymerans]